MLFKLPPPKPGCEFPEAKVCTTCVCCCYKTLYSLTSIHGNDTSYFCNYAPRILTLVVFKYTSAIHWVVVAVVVMVSYFLWCICMYSFWHVLYLLQEFFEFQSAHRSTILNALSRKYHAIGPLLIKMEGLVVYTNSGKSPRLKSYYAHWEKKIFDAIVKVSNRAETIMS